jgi:hypothetical protein
MQNHFRIQQGTRVRGQHELLIIVRSIRIRLAVCGRDIGSIEFAS